MGEAMEEGIRNVGELLAAAQTHLFVQRQFPGWLLSLQLPCAPGQHQLTIRSTMCDKGVVCQRPGKALPGSFGAGKKCSVKTAWQGAEKIVLFPSFEKRESVTDIMAREGKPNPRMQR